MSSSGTRGRGSSSDRGRIRGRGGRFLHSGDLSLEVDRLRRTQPSSQPPSSSSQPPSSHPASETPLSDPAGITMIPTPQFASSSRSVDAASHPSWGPAQQGSTHADDPPATDGDADQARQEEQEFLEDLEEEDEGAQRGRRGPRVRAIPRSDWEVEPGTGRFVLTVAGHG